MAITGIASEVTWLLYRCTLPCILTRTNTPDSIRDTESQVTILRAHQLLTENTLTSIKQRIAYLQNQKSDVHSVAQTNQSSKTRSSSHSSIKSKLATKKAEAEAAAVGVTFARKETHLKKQRAQQAERQASLEAELSLIQQEKAAAETAAQFHAFQTITDEIDSRAGDLPLPQENAVDRTRAYVESNGDHSYQRTADQTDADHPQIEQAGLNPTAPSFTPQIILDPNSICDFSFKVMYPRYFRRGVCRIPLIRYQVNRVGNSSDSGGTTKPSTTGNTLQNIKFSQLIEFIEHKQSFGNHRVSNLLVICINRT
ncbi:hypothetical protein LOTGIDRAFT_158860 [Lottia gigantea]|uniref:Uncharacterized protein n=1 Tax=Lottia gigantea TaxID=225164 RepID=V4A4U9_LOTGI|nr:hypothetical protein LOTGIDRAFT_158860 [Lottia gigantea]ESO98903.1 hypothetical protein LOTGIDRAFT_158860 [Lottia gigantea]